MDSPNTSTNPAILHLGTTVIPWSNIWGGGIPLSAIARSCSDWNSAWRARERSWREERMDETLLEFWTSWVGHGWRSPDSWRSSCSEFWEDEGASSASVPWLSHKESLGWLHTQRGSTKVLETHGRAAAGRRRIHPKHISIWNIKFQTQSRNFKEECSAQNLLPMEFRHNSLPEEWDRRGAQQALPAAGAPQWAPPAQLKPKIDFTECYLRGKSWIKLLLSKQRDKPFHSLGKLGKDSFLKFNLKWRSSGKNPSGFTWNGFPSRLLRGDPKAGPFPNPIFL